MHLPSTLLCALLILASAAQPSCVPAELRVLDEAAIVLHELHGPTIWPTPQPTPGGPAWQSILLSRSVALSRPSSRDLLRLIGSSTTYAPCVDRLEGGVVGCADPNYALTVTQGSRRLELLVMLECRRIELWQNGERVRVLSNLSEKGVFVLAQAFCQELSNTEHACSIARAKQPNPALQRTRFARR